MTDIDLDAMEAAAALTWAMKARKDAFIGQQGEAK